MRVEYVQTPEKSTHTLATRREQLYNLVDRRISVLRGVWGVAQSFPVASANDTEAEIQAEKDTLWECLQNGFEKIPGAHEKLQRHKELENAQYKIFARVVNGEIRDWYDDPEWDLISTERYQLEKDPDVVFFSRIEEGIESALLKREKVRYALSLGPQRLYSSQLLSDRITLRKHIKKVIPSRFSLNFIIEDQAYERYTKREKNKAVRDSSGFHMRPWVKIYPLKSRNMSVFNYIREFPFVNSDGKTDDPEILNARLQEAVDHEDFHTFVDLFGFWYPIKPKNLPAPLSKKMVLAHMNGYHDELLAELASILKRDDIPKRTFARELKKKYDEWQKAHETVPSGISSPLPSDLNSYRYYIKSLYHAVETYIPQRRIDLNLAFALFQPSELRHIPRLVRRWVYLGSQSDA